MIRRNTLRTLCNAGDGLIQRRSNTTTTGRSRYNRYVILSLICLLSVSLFNKNNSKHEFYFASSFTTTTTTTTTSLISSPLTQLAFQKPQKPLNTLLQFHQRNDNILLYPSTSTISLKSTSSGSNSNSNSDTINFSPKYLEQIDKYRGYRRKIMTQKYYNTTNTITSTANAAAMTDASSTTAQTPSSKLRQHILNVMNFFISDAMKDDLIRRRKVYVSDWTDAFNNKRQIVPAILFLYFACLAPAVSFGTIASQITFGSMGIVEFLLSAGVSGILYSILCGQPMAFIAPTGLTLAFISGLYRFCSVNALPFFPIYSWVGLWTSFFFILLGLGGSSQWIRFCTRFTDEVFNALLSVNFI